MDEHLSLSVLLSEALLMFTIEFDNERKHQMQHSTMNHGSAALRRTSGRG
jgi:hypothetical protein